MEFRFEKNDSRIQELNFKRLDNISGRFVLNAELNFGVSTKDASDIVVRTLVFLNDSIDGEEIKEDLNYEEIQNLKSKREIAQIIVDTEFKTNNESFELGEGAISQEILDKMYKIGVDEALKYLGKLLKNSYDADFHLETLNSKE